jgi:soluble lytic murein transglycosylase-like protein
MDKGPLRAPALDRALIRSARAYQGNRRSTDRFDGLLLSAGLLFGIDPRLLKALIAVESSFRQTARSRMGALGLMQLMPAAAKEVGVGPMLLAEPVFNVYAGAAYLSRLFNKALRRYRMRHLAPGEVPSWVLGRVLAAYNSGPRCLGRKYLSSHARRYVRKVLFFYLSEVSDLRFNRVRAQAAG